MQIHLKKLLSYIFDVATWQVKHCLAKYDVTAKDDKEAKILEGEEKA